MKDISLPPLISSASVSIPQNIAATTGTSDADFEKLSEILSMDHTDSIGYICIDVANGYSQFFVEFIAKTREQWPNTTIIAGNVVTAEMVEELLLAGADIIKVGIGPGSVCTTRKKTVRLSCSPRSSSSVHRLYLSHHRESDIHN